jgi:phage terminase small subunit
VARNRRPGQGGAGPPDWLSPEALDIFERTRTARPDADLELVTMYACAVADLHRAQTLLDKSGPVVKGVKGLVRNPLQAVKQANAATVRALAKDLGLAEATGDDLAPAAGRRTRNQKAAEATIASLRQLGRIEPVDEATIGLVRSLARTLDAIEPDDPAVGSLARTQLQALRMLRGTTDDSANALAALLASVSAEMGDAPDT